MFMAQRKVFYKGPWYSQGPFHSSVRQYNCRENFVRWSALHDYSSIRITGVICQYSQIPKISFLQSVIQESEMFNGLWDRTFEWLLPRDRNIEFGCISHEKFPLSHQFGPEWIFQLLQFSENVICSASWWGVGSSVHPKNWRSLSYTVLNQARTSLEDVEVIGSWIMYQRGEMPCS